MSVRDCDVCDASVRAALLVGAYCVLARDATDIGAGHCTDER